MRKSTSWVLICGLLLGGVAGCGDEPAAQLAPEAKGSALASSAPKSAAAKAYTINKGASMVVFNMEAPDEKIRGKAEGSTEGTLFIDPKDLSQTTGNIVVDIDSLVLVQRKKDDSGAFKDEENVPKQNEHARAWLEIDANAPAEIRAKNKRVEFRISSIESVSEKDLSKLSGAERTVTLKAKGDFLLHQRQSVKTVDLKATFTYEGDNPTGVVIKTASPFAVGLAEHDVRPRDGFGKLAAKGLDALGSKVAKEAMVELDLKLVLGEGGSKMAAPPATTTAAPTAPAPGSASAAPSASAPAGVPSADPSAKPKAK